MAQKQLLEATIRAIEAAFRPEFKYIGITRGGTEKSRDYTHIFVPGPLYGGKLGMTLCRRPWIAFHVYPRGHTRQDVCPQCAEKLRKMAIIAADLYPQDLFDIASGAQVKPITPEDIGTILKEYARRSRKQKVKAEPIPMFDVSEVTVTVRRTEPWAKAFQ